MTLGYLQTSPHFGDRERNFREVDDALSSRGSDKAIDLLVLPELFATGYAFTSREEALALSEAIDGPTAAFLRGVAARTGGVVVAGFAEREGDVCYNSSLIVTADGILGSYRKIHLFNAETLFFEPGTAPPPIVQVDGKRIGVMICFDWYFPETMRLLMVRGAEIVAHPSNLVLPFCQRAMTTRCLENRMYAVTTNRVGRETRGDYDFRFTGSSQITGLDGTVLSSASEDAPALGTAEVDPTLARDKNINPYNNLAGDRRVELYGDLLAADQRPSKEDQ